jgi:uncharacterized protein YggE
MNSTITVPGAGTVVVEPDICSVRLGVNVIATTAGAARESAAQTMNAILDAVLAQGVARRDVRTALVSLNPTMDYSDNSGPRITGYQVQNSVSVTLRDLTKAGQLIDAALGAGASTLDSLEFRLEDPMQAADQARVYAMADAKARAETIANAAGQPLGPVTSVTEGQFISPPMPFAAQRMSLKAEDASTPVESGTQEISVALTVTYALGEGG